jgi:dihydrodipicolinate synthase/N-acetylneuraminate lyase
MPIPHGIYPVIHTPLHLDQAVDIVNFEACLRHYLTTDITGVTILGSGGELPYFSDKEQLELLISAHLTIGAHKKIIVGYKPTRQHKPLIRLITTNLMLMPYYC